MGVIADNYELICHSTTSGTAIFTELVDELSWGSDINTLGSQLSFQIARVPGQPSIYLGDILSLTNNAVEIFRGVVVDETTTQNAKGIKAYDFAWYLNKSTVPMQFKKMRASEAIKALCAAADVPVGTIADMSTAITKMYKTEKVADAIRDIIKQHELSAGVKMRMEMLAGSLSVYNWGDLAIDPQYTAAENVAPVYAVDAYGKDWSLTRTLSDFANSVIAYKGEAPTKVQDTASIGAFGLIQTVISSDKDKNARQEATTTLEQSNVIPEDLSMQLLGDDSMIAGRVMSIPSLGGTWLIRTADHKVRKGIHLCDVTLRKVG